MLDIILLVVLLAGVLWGWWKGFFEQLASLVGAIAGFILACVIYAKWGDVLIPQGTNLSTNLLIFVVLWLGIPFALTFIAKILDGILSAIHLGWINHLAGAALGLIKVALFLSLFLTAFDFFTKFEDNPMLSETEKESSLLYYPVQGLAGSILPSDFLNKLTGNIIDKK